MSDTKLNSDNKEVEALLRDKFLTLEKHDDDDDDDDDDDTSKPTIEATEEDKNIPAGNEECKVFMAEETFETSLDKYTTKNERKKITINKSLLAFRVVTFLWSGSGSLNLIFLPIFLKHRGLTLSELSSVFSVIFIFQFMTSFVTGIITDKIGNPKPVIFFLVFSTNFIHICMLLTPNINSEFCSHLNKNINYTNISQSEQTFSSCYSSCLYEENNTEQNFTEDFSVIENSSLIINNNKTVCDFSIRLTKNSFNLSKIHCCDVCADSEYVGCNKTRKGYLLVVYVILMLGFYAVRNSTISFLDFAAVSLCAKNDSHFGKERIFATCGMFIATVIVVFVLNVDKSSGPKINFDPVIWIATGMQILSFLTLFMVKIPILPPGKKLINKAFDLLKNIDVLAFILLVFVVGNGFGFYYVLHLVFLETINTPSIVVSLHSVAIVLCGFPVLFTSQWWLKKIGTNKLFILCLLSYTMKIAAYSYIYNPWWSLLIDMNVAFTYHLFWVALVVHCRNVAPSGFAATLNALTGAVHNGIGRSSGVFFGGMLMNYTGPRETYRVMAAIFFATALLYSIFLFIRQKSPNIITVNGDETTATKHSRNTEITNV